MIMKKVFLTGMLVIFSATALISCRKDTEKETVIREVKVERTEDREGILERSGKKVDDKINKEIDKKIN